MFRYTIEQHFLGFPAGISGFFDSLIGAKEILFFLKNYLGNIFPANEIYAFMV